MRNSTSVLLYLRASKTAGWGTVYVRVTVNGRRLVDASTGVKILFSEWDSEKRQVSASNRAALLHNARITNTRNSLNLYLVDCELRQNGVSQARLTDIVVRGNFDAPTLLECFDRYLGVVEVQSAEGTYNTYRTRRAKLDEYLTETRQRKMMPEQFGAQEAERFRVWMLRTCSKVYAGKNLQVIKGLLSWARKEGYAKFHPLHDYRVRIPYEKELIYLTVGELSAIEATTFPTKSLAEVADCFLFSCYTGLGYAEVKRLYSVHIVSRNGRQAIRIARKKTGTESFVPLTEKAVKIWQKYGGQRLPVRSNSGYNVMLKAVAAHAGIDKALTTHIARKTFAMHALNVHGFKSEVVAKMLGHSSINQLKPYVFTEEDFVLREFNRVNDAANG